MDIQTVQYCLNYPDGTQHALELHMRADSLATIGWSSAEPPEWTGLEFQQCANCPLNSKTSPHCSPALNLASLVDKYHDIDLRESVQLEVKTLGRIVTLTTTVQKAIGSFIGLLVAVSDCPHGAFFRPIARFHLPMASEEETVYRSVAAYLVAQRFRHHSGQQAEFGLEGLYKVYNELETVNSALVTRIKQGAGDDNPIAQIMLEWDVFSGMFPMHAEALLNELRPLFAAYLSD